MVKDKHYNLFCDNYIDKENNFFIDNNSLTYNA